MIDRATMAMVDELRAQSCPTSGPYVIAHNPQQAMIEGVVDLAAGVAAAIRALRDPGPELLAAARKRARAGAQGLELWQAMIDVALEERR